MSIFEIMSKTETQSVQLEYARAILSEVENYFSDNDNIKWLPYYANHILLLIQVADKLLFDMQPELEQIIHNLHEQNKKMQDNE